MQWVGIRRSVSFDIGEAEADPTGESTAGLAGPVESVAGEATIDRIASTAKFSDSVRAGKSSREHHFDSGRIPPESQDRNLYFVPSLFNDRQTRRLILKSMTADFLV
jgi:hypothetical protein